ncbi:MAG: tyrosine-type recombinase/integrase [Chitinophagaceae bacterium]
MSFENYLQEQKYSSATVARYTESIKRFISWCEAESLSVATFNYNDVLSFMRWCHAKGVTKRTVNNTLCVVRHYCSFLIAEGQRSDNPAAGIFIKGMVRKLPANLLSMEEMEELFKQYSIQMNVDSSKKIMLGLMVFQGLTVGEIMRLQSHHFRLDEGKVFVKGTTRSNERLLHLQALQLPPIQNYLSHNKQKEGAVFIEQIQKELSERNINNRIQYMFCQLKKLNQKVINPKQIRSSTITFWLRQNNLRQVQYMAGHKWVSSTERYQTNNLDDLQNELKNHHPMK